MFRRSSSSFDVLESSMNDSPITRQKVSQLPGEYKQTTQIWQAANKTCNHQSLGGIMCGSHRTIPLKGKDKPQIDFMCVTMIDPETSWFELVELPISQQELDIPKGTRDKGAKTNIYN